MMKVYTTILSRLETRCCKTQTGKNYGLKLVGFPWNINRCQSHEEERGALETKQTLGLWQWGKLMV